MRGSSWGMGENEKYWEQLERVVEVLAKPAPSNFSRSSALRKHDPREGRHPCVTFTRPHKGVSSLRCGGVIEKGNERLPSPLKTHATEGTLC